MSSARKQIKMLRIFSVPKIFDFREPLIVGGIPSPRKTRFFGMQGKLCFPAQKSTAFLVPEIYDFPAHQKPLESEADKIVPPISDGWFLTNFQVSKIYDFRNI